MATPPPSSSVAGELKSPDTPLFRSLLKTKWKKTNAHTPASDAKTHLRSRRKQVMLLDWWLTKVKVEVPNALFKLGVTGYASFGRSVVYFSSTEIVSRHIGGTLETTDGITITLTGLINRSRAHENGFPSQVCSLFAFGFPFDWEQIGDKYFRGESVDRGRPSNVTSVSNGDANSSPGLSFKDPPVTRFFDHMMLSSGDYNECTQIRSLFDDILNDSLLTECGGTPLNASKKNNRSVVAKSFPLHKALIERLRDKEVSSILDAMPMVTGDSWAVSNQSTTYDDDHRPSECALTRSKNGSKASKNNQVEGLSSNTNTPRTSIKKQSGKINKTNASNVIQPAIQNAGSSEVGGILDSSSKFQGSDVATREVAISKLSISNQDHNCAPAALNLE